MSTQRVLAGACMLLAASCAATPSGQQPRAWNSPPPPTARRVSGILGITEVNALTLDVDSSVGSTVRDDELSLPMIGAQVQVPRKHGRLEWGLEGGFSLGWESDRNAVAINTGAILVVADNDLRLFDLSGGAYVAKTVGQGTRLYAAAGPLVQFGHMDLELDQLINGSGSLTEDGIGLGYYSRAGIDFETSPGSAVGLVVRWVDSTIDFGGAFDDLDIQALQLGVVFTSGF